MATTVSIVIVEDDESLQMLLDATLVGYYIVGKARTLAEAEKLITPLKAEAGPKVLITDNELAGEPSGEIVAGKFRGSIPEIKVLACSAREWQGVGDVHLSKPFDLVRLVQAVEELARQSAEEV